MTRLFTFFLSLFLILNVLGQSQTKNGNLANRDKYLFGAKIKNRNFTEAIPFTEVNNLMFVKVQINGTDYNFIFDTGCVTILSMPLQEKLQLKEVMRNTLTDAAGEVKEEKFHSLDNIKMGNVTFRSVGTAVMDLSKLSEQFCAPVDGIVGANLMRTCYWKIDYKNKRLIFSDRELSPETPSYKLLFEETFSGSPVVSMNFGNYEFQAIFDSGNNQSFNLPDSLYFKSNASYNKMIKRGRGNNEFTLYGNKTITDHATILDSVTIGNKVFTRQIARVSPAPEPLLGNEFLMKFDEVIINWKKHVIYLPENFRGDEPQTTIGFVPLYDKGKIVVSFIWEDSDAYQKGLELGDTITAIDSMPLDIITPEEWCSIRETIREKTSLTIKVLKKDATETTLTLSRYNLLD